MMESPGTRDPGPGRPPLSNELVAWRLGLVENSVKDVHTRLDRFESKQDGRWWTVIWSIAAGACVLCGSMAVIIIDFLQHPH